MPKKTEEILEDVLHFYYSDLIATFPQSARKNLYGGTFFERLSNAVKYFGRSFKESFRSSPPPADQISDKVWLYVIGDNNYNSLKFLKNKIGDTVYISPFRYTKAEASIFSLNHASRFRHLLKSIPVFLQLFFSGRKEVSRAWDAVFRAGGLYDYSLEILKTYAPEAIVFSNDTTLEPRSLMLAAKALRIPTFYIQHACVREDFPPLKFTCSFLEGEDALQKYKQSGPIEGNVKLIGVPKIDPYLSRKNTNQSVKNIGICSNLLDPLPEIEKVLTQLIDSFPECFITYRPHPGDKRVLSQMPERLHISNSRVENSFEFLLNQDLIIAGNTSIHYEAAMLNVVSVYCKFDVSSPLDDTYGFVRNGLVREAKDISELISEIRSNIVRKRDMGEKARYYNAVLGGVDEGGSAALVIKQIKKYLT